MAFTAHSAILAAGILTLTAALPAHSEVADFGQGTQIGRVTTAPDLSPGSRTLYREFRRVARYFGAFATHPVTGHGFYVLNFHDTQKARAAAIEGCNQLAQASGCQLVAIAMPESLPVDQTQASGLSEQASDAFATDYQDNRVAGRYAAFALSGSSHYGYANAWDSEAYAKDTALAYCQSAVAQDMVRIGPQGRTYARARGLDTCRIIDVERHTE